MKNKLLILLFTLGTFTIASGFLNMLNSEISAMYTWGFIGSGVLVIAIPVGYVKMKLGKLLLSFKNGQDFQEVMADSEKYQIEFGPSYQKK
jgi:hypothetical protein